VALTAACALLASVLVALAPPSGAQEEPLKGTVPALRVEGNTLRDPNGNKVVLRGVSLPGLEAGAGPNGERAPQGIFSRIDMATDASQGWHARIIRLPVSRPYDTWDKDPDAYFSTYLDPAVRHCVARKVYCIVDLHHIGDYDDRRMAQVREFWRYVAPRYAGVSNVFYELYNEPVQRGDDASWATWRNLIQPVVDEVRAVAPDNIILVGSPRYDTGLREHELRTNPVRGKNLVYVAHIYPAVKPSQFDLIWGDASNVVPVCITEWGWDADWPQKNVPFIATTSGWGQPFIRDMDSRPGLACDTAWAFDSYWGPRMFELDWSVKGGERGMGQAVKDRLAAMADNDQPTGGASGGAAPAAPAPTTRAPEGTASPVPSAPDPEADAEGAAAPADPEPTATSGGGSSSSAPPPAGGGGSAPDGGAAGLLARLQELVQQLRVALQSLMG